MLNHFIDSNSMLTGHSSGSYLADASVLFIQVQVWPFKIRAPLLNLGVSDLQPGVMFGVIPDDHSTSYLVSAKEY